MINIETLPDNVLQIRVLGKLEEADLRKIGGEVDRLMQMRAGLKLLIEATGFEGWENAQAAKRHFTFVRDHHRRIERIALVAGHQWQHWIAGIASVFVHPEIKVFDKNDTHAAQDWLLHKQAA